MFTGDAGNLVNGVVNNSGQSLEQFGTVTAAFEGWYDLSGIPLPRGVTQADYQLTFEAINPLYTGTESVGPYSLGQVTPSGTMPVVILRGLAVGSTTEVDETIADSAGDANSGGDGVEAAPAAVPTTGEWLARLSAYGHESWLRWHVRGGRQVTVEAQPLDERGLETAGKARIVAGIWNGDDPLGIAPEVGTPQPFNAIPTGLTTLSFESSNDGDVRLALADQCGDGRPDYLYRGRVLYADTITPLRIAIGGGPIVIDGMGFRPGNSVAVGGLMAAITSITPTEITAVAPASAGGMMGNVDVTVTDSETEGWTTIEGASGSGLSYGPQSSDGIRIVTAPVNAVLMGIPLPFTVQAIGADGVSPASGVNVTYTVTKGSGGHCLRPQCLHRDYRRRWDRHDHGRGQVDGARSHDRFARQWSKRDDGIHRRHAAGHRRYQPNVISRPGSGLQLGATSYRAEQGRPLFRTDSGMERGRRRGSSIGNQRQRHQWHGLDPSHSRPAGS